jgi:hypothetical protein
MGISKPPHEEYLSFSKEEGYKINEDAPKKVRDVLEKWIKTYNDGDVHLIRKT